MGDAPAVTLVVVKCVQGVEAAALLTETFVHAGTHHAWTPHAALTLAPHT